jgi:hypothetical protein
MRMIVAVTVVAILAIPAYAQEMPKPGPEHEWLKKKVGTWETTMKFGDKESKGTITFKMELGGLWLAGKLESELFGQKFSGRSLDSYDPVKKKYIGVWVDSMSTSPVTIEGTYDKTKNELTMIGSGPGMDGKTTTYRSVTKMMDSDTEVMAMYVGDAKEATFAVTYTRKK